MGSLCFAEKILSALSTVTLQMAWKWMTGDRDLQTTLKIVTILVEKTAISARSELAGSESEFLRARHLLLVIVLPLPHL